MVGTVPPRWFPSLFQIRNELPESSVKMSGSMLPPQSPSSMVGDWSRPLSQTAGCGLLST